MRRLGLGALAGRVARRITDVLLLTLGEAATSLLVRGSKAVFPGLLLDLILGEPGQLLGGVHVALLLKEALGKDEIDLLEGAASSLRVVEVDDGEENGVQDGEEEVRTPAALAQVVDQDRGNHDDEEVPEPVRNGRRGIGLRAGLKRVDLSRVQPRQRQPSGAEECDVSEETDGGATGSLRGTGDQSTEGEDHGQTLADGADEEQLAATDTLDSEPRSRGENRVNNHVDTTEKQRQVVVSADRGLEQNREVVDDSVATRQLLHHLRRGAENQATEVLGLATSEKGLHWRHAAMVARGTDGLSDDGHLGADVGLFAAGSVESR